MGGSIPSFLKKFGQQAGSITLGLITVFACFMLLPVLQVITRPPAKDSTIRTVNIAEIAPPPPPPAEEPEEPELEEPPAPPPVAETLPLEFSQLELALEPGEGMFGSGFSAAPDDAIKRSEEADAVFSLFELDQKPHAVYQPAPIYPPELARKKMQGTVYVLFIVDQNGRTRNLKVQKSTHPAFNPSAIRAVKQWRFEPGKRRGESVAFRMRVPITFQK